MEIDIINARNKFFHNSSFEMIYNEAFANSLDAGADLFKIDIYMSKAGDWDNLQVTLYDNGVGFTDINFSKFSKLMSVQEKTHKGLGRLVYLNYFTKATITSVYDRNKKRSFIFDDSFVGASEIEPISDQENYTEIKLSGYNKEKIGKTDYVSPDYIKKVIFENFFMRFYCAKKDKKPISVEIVSRVNNSRHVSRINPEDIPSFSIKEVHQCSGVFNKGYLYYSIKKLDEEHKRQLITSISVDGRSQKVDFISKENMPWGYEMIFMLVSEVFNGTTDESRELLNFTPNEKRLISRIFRHAVATVINENLPQIANENKKRKQNLSQRYPHLEGFFDVETIGFVDEHDVLAHAQEQYFKEQKEVLSADNLDDEKFEKALNLSSRALAEYILFRQNVIKRMKSLTSDNLEKDLHNLFAPQRLRQEEKDFASTVYRNNVWVLDDKFMSYRTILSEEKMTEVVNVLTKGERKESDQDRPDIVLYFSAEPNKTEKFDMVIVELKRLGLKPEVNSDVEIQLEERARRLSSYFNDKIQRIWFYGVVEIDNTYIRHLKTRGFAPLFSKGAMYYKQIRVFLDEDTDKSVFAETFILNYQSLVNDAEIRNETFLRILRESFSHGN